jgi:hypothetical protein
MSDCWLQLPSPTPRSWTSWSWVAETLTLIGHKIYNDSELEQRLWRKRRIRLLPLRKDNQKKQ